MLLAPEIPGESNSVIVGIIANPVSARDIRRITSNAGNLSINDRANMVARMLKGLVAADVHNVVIMPEFSGIATQLHRIIKRAGNAGMAAFPRLSWLDMPVGGSWEDSALAAQMMRDLGVGAIIVLGGDGTNRVVASRCGRIPIAGVSTGTNNAMPEIREPTITGLAVGLAATGKIPEQHAFLANKRLDVMVNDQSDIALVDVAVVADRYVGAKAIWKPEDFRDLFTTFGSPENIGMSSIVGLLAPLSRHKPEGRRIRFSPADKAELSLLAPIAPGQIEAVGISGIETIMPEIAYRPGVSAGCLALDGERELVFGQADRVSIRLKLDAFRTVNVPGCMDYAAQNGLLTNNPVSGFADAPHQQGVPKYEQYTASG